MKKGGLCLPFSTPTNYLAYFGIMPEAGGAAGFDMFPA